MLRRRVPVLKLGSRGPGGDARSLRLWTQASVSVRKLRKRPQASASVGKRSQAFASVRGVLDMPEKRKSPRNAELSSLLDSSCVFASQKCQQSGIRGGVVAKRRNVVTFGLVSGLRVSKVSTGIGRGPGREA